MKTIHGLCMFALLALGTVLCRCPCEETRKPPEKKLACYGEPSDCGCGCGESEDIWEV